MVYNGQDNGIFRAIYTSDGKKAESAADFATAASMAELFKNAKTDDERKKLFNGSPEGFLGELKINPEADFKGADAANLLADYHALKQDNGRNPISSLQEDVVLAFDSINTTPESNEAKYLLEKKAREKYDTYNLASLTTKQLNEFLASKDIEAIENSTSVTDRDAEARKFLKKIREAFAKRDKLNRAIELRNGRIERLWNAIEPMAVQNANKILKTDSVVSLRVKQPEQAPTQTVTAEQTADPNAQTVTAQPLDPANTPNVQQQNPNDPGQTVQGQQTQQPGQTVQGQQTQQPGQTVQGQQVPQPVVTAQTQLAPPPPNITVSHKDFAKGFKMSNEAKEAVADKNKQFSLWSIMEQFASAKTPEDAFQSLLINALLYLPNKVAWGLDMMVARKREKNRYIKEQIERHDDAVAASKGMGAPERLATIHKEMAQTFGNLPEAAALLRKEHPELVDDLGLQFNKDGTLIGEPSKKDLETIRKRILQKNYFETYGHMPTNEKLKYLQEESKRLQKIGAYHNMGVNMMANAALAQQPAP
ncbi:MAG: hypothetical protein J6P93_04400, partial [Alphaproteobacteria bacterium]|nr:hypothetical protein [Alphaproteobacteria bacterium]